MTKKIRRYKKLSDYAKEYGITYRSAWNRYNAGKINGAFKDENGSIFIPIFSEDKPYKRAAIYARVSNNDRRTDLQAQRERLESYAIENGYEVTYSIKEVGSGMNDSRIGLTNLLMKNDWDTLIVEHKDRLTRFGFKYIEILLNMRGKEVRVVNTATGDRDDLLSDLVAIIYSFSARLYGLRRKKKREEIIDFLQQ
jgi:predicted site-specific integrase-resolvase